MAIESDPTAPARPIGVFGGRGGGTIAAQSIEAIAEAGGDLSLLGLLNDQHLPGEHVGGVPVLGPFATWRELPERTGFVAPLHKVTEQGARARLVETLGVPEERWVTVVDPAARCARDTELGAGCLVNQFATVGPGCRLGRHVAVRPGAVVSHDVAVGDFAFVGMNASLCGYVEVGEGAHIAPQATVRENVRIGRYAIVGLGAVVCVDVPDFATVVGVPARPVDAPRELRPVA